MYSPIVYDFMPGKVLALKHETVLRYAKETDINAVESLRRKDSGSLGMIHKNNYLSVATKSRQDNRDRWKSQHLYVLEDGFLSNAEITGFCYVSYYQKDYSEIIQICVRQDLRRIERALMFIEQVSKVSLLLNKSYIRCRVACDIEAVKFWLAIGFTVENVVLSTHLNTGISKSKRPLYIFTRQIMLSVL